MNPGHVGIGIYRLDIKLHVGVLCTTILRTDSLIGARIIRFKPFRIVMPWYNISLTSELGNPEAMDHIVREKINMHNRISWYFKCISSRDTLLWIVEFPPPLVTDRCHRHLVGISRLRLWSHL